MPWSYFSNGGTLVCIKSKIILITILNSRGVTSDHMISTPLETFFKKSLLMNFGSILKIKNGHQIHSRVYNKFKKKKISTQKVL